MIDRKKGFLPMLLLSLVLLISAFITIIPFEGAVTENLAGYRSLSILTPLSTAFLLIASFLANIIRKRYFIHHK